jgi:hypothetical protein
MYSSIPLTLHTGFFGTAASGLGTLKSHTISILLLTSNTGNIAGAATNTVGQGVAGITNTTGDVVSGAGKGLGNAVTGVTQGLGDTTKGKKNSNGVFRTSANVVIAAGNMVGDTTKAGTGRAQNDAVTKQ